MSPDFWKQFPPIPGFDCVKMKHDIQAKIYEETKDMSWEERRAYLQRKAEAFRRRMEAAGEMVLREEPPEYRGK